MSVSIGLAYVKDLQAILELLTKSKLPQEGLGDHIATTLVAREGDKVIGSAALEIYDTSALLRSVAVEPSMRGKGLGQRLTQAALELAWKKGITHLYLLTETAGDFFPRFGFHAVDRPKVPSSVQKSVEFTSVCPKSALAMERCLDSHQGSIEVMEYRASPKFECLKSALDGVTIRCKAGIFDGRRIFFSGR